MAGNDWNNLGRDIKNIVQDALETGDFGRLNRELGVTIEDALGNVADSVKNAAQNGVNNAKRGIYNNGRKQYDSPYMKYSDKYQEKYRHHSSSPEKKSVEEARENFALYVNTGGSRAMGILLTALGFTLFGMFGVTALTFGIIGIFVPAIADKLVPLLSVFLSSMAVSGVVGVIGNSIRKKVKRFRAYVHTLNGKTYAKISDLAKSVRKPESYVRKDIRKMLDKRMFLEGHLDDKQTCLITSEEAYRQYLETKQQLEVKATQEKEQAFQQEQACSQAGAETDEARKVIEEGNQFVEQIRRCNDAIQGIEISNKMYHLENVIQRILKRVEQHPELIDDLHKFMDYYLPTTVKLLKAYEELDRQDVAGENIKTAKKEIENTLDTINVAFENLLDSFFRDTAWDVSTDISVLKTMLAQEGLTGGDDFQGKDKS